MGHEGVEDTHRRDFAVLEGPLRVGGDHPVMDQEHHQGVHRPRTGRHREPAPPHEQDAADDDRQKVQEREGALGAPRQVDEPGDDRQVAHQLHVHLGTGGPHAAQQHGVADRQQVGADEEQIEGGQRQERPVQELDDEGAEQQGRDDHDPEGHEPFELPAKLPLLRLHPCA